MTKFWETKKLSQLTDEEWELLCDGCGRCCLHKLENVEEKKFYYTSISCHLLDQETCRCSDYNNRLSKVDDCLKIEKTRPHVFDFLPSSCAYKKLYNNEQLESWHPLVSGNKESVHNYGISVRNKIISENDLDEDVEYIDYIIDLDI